MRHGLTGLQWACLARHTHWRWVVLVRLVRDIEYGVPDRSYIHNEHEWLYLSGRTRAAWFSGMHP